MFEIIVLGILTIFFILAASKLDDTIRSEAKRTRKDIQEVKTAQRQTRKDLNEVQKFTKLFSRRMAGNLTKNTKK